MDDKNFLELLEKIVGVGTEGINHHLDLVTSDISEYEVLTLIEEFLELGYVKADETPSVAGTRYEEIKATKKGKDRLKPDGGETARTNTVIIKFHDEEILGLIKQHITTSSLSKDQKQLLSDQLRELPSESIKHVALKLMEMGLQNAPGALGSLYTLIQSLPA